MKAPKEARRPRGRPATGQTPKRYFRMDDEAWAAVEEAAERAGVTVSEWIRDRLGKAVKRESRAP
jgi:predicted HicB family RNase H-like nuclease